MPTRASWTTVDAHNFDQIVADLQQMLEGKKATLLSTENVDFDAAKAIPMERRTVTVARIESDASADGQKWVLIKDPAGENIAVFWLPTKDSGFKVPCLSVHIDHETKTVQFMEPTMPGFGHWIFLF